MATPAGTGPLALLDLPDPCIMGTGNDVAAYGLAARILTPPNAAEEWGEPTPVASVDLRQAMGSRLDAAGLRSWERACEAALGQDDRVDSVSVSLSLVNRILRASVSCEGAAGPFSFVVTVDNASAQVFRGS